MLRRFKKQCERANIVNEVRERQYYEKPNQKKHKKNQEIARRKKLQAKRDALANSRYREAWVIKETTSLSLKRFSRDKIFPRKVTPKHGQSQVHRDKPNITVRFLRRNY